MNHFNVPPPGQTSRTITLTWTKKKRANWWKVRVKTQSGLKYTSAPKHFAACG